MTMKLGVFLPNWIGDAVMATPALRAIRSGFPDAEIVGIGRSYVAEVLAGLDLVDRLVPCDSPNSRIAVQSAPSAASDQSARSARGGLHGNPTEGLVRLLKDERFDAILLLTNSFRTAWLAWRSGAKRRVGFARDWRGWLLTERLVPKSTRTPNPVIDEYNRLAIALGCRAVTRRTELATTAADEALYEAFWADRDWQLRANGIVALNPGGAFGAAKHWPVEHFAAVARRVVDELEMTPLVLSGPGEVDRAREIVRLADRDAVQTLADGPIGLGVTKAAVRDSRLLITTDSGPRHFAAPFGVPVVSLFGPTHIAWSETFDDRAVHLQLDVDCGPCQQRVCPLGHHRCMTELSPDRVFRAAVELLERVKRRAA
jgi:heptosyltransferase II